MPIDRNTNLPEHDLNQGHYGELPIEGLPSATGYPSGSAFLWDGNAWYYGAVSTGSGSSGVDEKVKVSSNDTTGNYLVNKVVAGANITLTENNDGSNETLTVTAASGSDHKVLGSANDTTSNYLLPKLSGSGNITLYQYNDGSNETIVISGTSASTSLNVQEDTASIVAAAAALDFVGADFDVTNEGANVAGVGISAPTSITPTQLSANTDNWNPTGLASTDIIRASTDASRNLTGIAAPALARAIVLENIGANNIVLIHNATSTAANRFFLPSDSNLTLPTDSAVLLVYDTSSTRWRLVGGVGTAGSVDAADVTFTPTSPMVTLNVQDAIDEVLGLIVLPLTATVSGSGVLVFDENDSVIGVEVY